VSNPPLGPPGHLPGYHLLGTLTPIGAVASAAPRPMIPAAPPPPPPPPPPAAVAPPTALETPVRDDRFNGYWTLFSAQPYLPETFAYHVTACTGVCTKTNAPRVFNVGDVIFQVDAVWNNRFHARQIFTDGRWYRCSGLLTDDEMRLEGNHWRWVMIRVLAQTTLIGTHRSRVGQYPTGRPGPLCPDVAPPGLGSGPAAPSTRSTLLLRSSR
jgi:hypothetical protein